VGVILKLGSCNYIQISALANKLLSYMVVVHWTNHLIEFNLMIEGTINLRNCT